MKLHGERDFSYPLSCICYVATSVARITGYALRADVCGRNRVVTVLATHHARLVLEAGPHICP